MKFSAQLLFFLILIHLSSFAQESNLYLHPNQGQWAKEILYRLPLQNGEFLVDHEGFTAVLSDYRHSHQANQVNHHQADSFQVQVIKLKFDQVNWGGQKEEKGYATFYENYFLGNDRLKWKSRINPCESTKLKAFIPGADLILTTVKQQFEYSFEVTDPSLFQGVSQTIEGAESVLKNDKGEIVVKTIQGDLIIQQPKAWVINTQTGDKKSISIEYVLIGNKFKFLYSYNLQEGETLYIDPVLVFSTFSGSTADNWGMTATPDPQGNLYAGGITFGGGGAYPTTAGVYSQSYVGGANYLLGSLYIYGFDISISKFDASGTNLLYATYLGGTENEAPHSMICDPAGNLFVFGVTSSRDFPVYSTAIQPLFGGGVNLVTNELGYSAIDIYVAKIANNGTSLLAGTFFGGSGNDGVNEGGKLNFNYGDPFRGEITLDQSGNVLIASTTFSSDFPIKNALQSQLNGNQDAVVFKMSSNLSQLFWSTYFGGGSDESGNAIQVASTGDVFITGGTLSSDLSIFNGNQVAYAGNGDGFLLKISGGSGAAIASTYIGGSAYDQAYFVQLDQADEVYVFGQSESNLAITTGKYGISNSGQFIRKYSNNLQTVIWSTKIGAGTGFAEISPTAFLVSNCGEIYIAGWGGTVNVQNSNGAFKSTTNGFPVTADAIQSTTNGSNFYLAVLAKDATKLRYGSYMGGVASSYNHVDGGTSRFDKNGTIYHAVCAACGGQTNGFLTTSSVYSATNNSSNCNLAAFKIEMGSTQANILLSSDSICSNNSAVFNGKSIYGNASFWDFGDGTISTNLTVNHVYSTPGVYQVKLIVYDTNACLAGDTAFVQVKVKGFLPKVVYPTSRICYPQSVDFTASGGISYEWLPANQFVNNKLPTEHVLLDRSNANVNYSVIVKGDCGIDTLPVQLLLPSIFPKVSNDTTICPNGVAQLEIKNTISQTWKPGTGLNSPSASSPIATPQVSTIYVVNARTSEGCDFVDTVSVFLQDPLTVQLTDSLSNCIGDSVLVAFSGGTTHDLSMNQNYIVSSTTSFIAYPSQSCYYYVEFSNQCEQILDSVWIKVIDPKMKVAQDTVLCPNMKLVLKASGLDHYEWYPKDNFPIIQGDSAVGIFKNTTEVKVIGFDQNNCSVIDSFKVILYPAPSVTANNSIYTFVGDEEVYLGFSTNDSLATFSWSPAEYLSCNECFLPRLTESNSGYYVIHMQDTNHCQASDSLFVQFDGYIYVPNSFTPDQNKLNNEFKPICENMIYYELSIYNRWGELLFHTNEINHGWDGKFNGELVQNGTYTWKILYQDATSIKKERIGHVNVIK